ncbi:hypothetical protein T8K17_04180 [Thalassobaculum sp. OXR-137]|uniref:hypothetical protein n=1 Tax=Thalassobaculum sp. OXR-137 TaxID=3100173 RepID=UPI002AC92C2B|nr:hypothetical protein [Thalassobaculum sp. OXR-137]WPZ35345.1 hypothetical protein T8K17_04180 [Thalassobaculum sp. OXR-137]
MPKILMTAAALTVGAFALSACGNTATERGVTGAGLGGAAGYAVGAPLLGAAAGGAAGAFTEKDDVNLGNPIWDWD